MNTLPVRIIFLREVIQRGKKGKTVWLVGDFERCARVPIHARNTLFEVARRLIEQPGRRFTNSNLGYTRGRTAIAAWWRRFETYLIDRGLGHVAAAFDRCLIIEDGSVQFRPRPEIQFLTPKRLFSVTEIPGHKKVG